MTVTQTQVVTITQDVTYDGTNHSALISAFPNGTVRDITDGTCRIRIDQGRGISSNVQPGDHVVSMTLNGAPWIAVLSAAQYADLIETV